MTPIDPRFIAAYKEYVKSLDPHEAAIMVQFGRYTFTEPQILPHLETNSILGREWYDVILEGTLSRLTPEDRAQIQATPELLVERITEKFRNAIEKRKTLV